MDLHPEIRRGFVNAKHLSLRSVVQDTPFSVVFGFCKYVVTPIEELIKSVRGRTTLVAFRDLPLDVSFPLFHRKMAQLEQPSVENTHIKAVNIPQRV